MPYGHDGLLLGQNECGVLVKAHRVKLPAPTDSTLQLVRIAMWILKQIYKPGFRYIKAGVMLDEIVPAGGQQTDLFGFQDASEERSAKLMTTMDSINRRWGKQTVRTASQGYRKDWEMRRERLSRATRPGGKIYLLSDKGA
jgi:DNA polymerase V